MPIPGAKPGEQFVRLEIYDEVVRTRINRNSQYSFLKRKILEDLDIHVANRAVNIRVTCNGISDTTNFILENFPSDDALLGTNFLEQFGLN